MPHKHRRDKSKSDASYYDLAPSKPVHISRTANPITDSTTKRATKLSKRKHARQEDDTPRAFTRLLHTYRPPRSGLDDGIRPKRRKASEPPTFSESQTQPSTTTLPTIQPHEPLSSFGARVDAALPFSGLSKRGGGGKELGAERRTKTEKKMQKMQKEWREEEQRRKEKIEAEEDEAIVVEGDLDSLAKTEPKAVRRFGKRKREIGGRPGSRNDTEDIWAHIKGKRIEDDGEKATSGLIGLHDVVQAPPSFSKPPRSRNDPSQYQKFGGLKQKFELSHARTSVVEGYRQMMKARREGHTLH